MRCEAGQINRLGDRDENQDRYVLIEDDSGLLMAVADGMGGHARGDLAAQAFVDVLARRFRNRQGLEDPEQFLRDCFREAHRSIISVGRAQNPAVQPLTTGVACLIQGATAHWAHVGDSRLYLLREGRVWIRTRDHTRVADLLESGLITEQRARIHPLRNQVSRCLGGGSRLPQVSSGPCVYLQEGDVVLLCTDGLWSALPDARLFALLDAGDLATELDILSTEAESVCYPRSDNITAVAIRWEGERSDDARSRRSKRPQLMPPSADDPVARAIAEIEQALEEYQGEMKDCCSR